MNFIAREVILQAVRAMRPVMDIVRTKDRELHEQMRSALSSAALNLDEGAAQRHGQQRARYQTAAGSAREVRMGLQLAIAFGYVSGEAAAEADALLDRFGALTWRLQHPKR